MKNEKLLDYLSVVCMALILLLVLGQVIMRYIFNSPLVWSEELAVYCMVWLAFTGAIMAMRDKEHIEVNIILVFLPEKARRLMKLVSKSITAIFLIVLTIYGFRLTIENYNIPSAANQIPMGYVYIIIPVSAIGMLYYNVKHILRGE
jgi:TRAP-type C4-dicarboxylate transport system permease small subunit